MTQRDNDRLRTDPEISSLYARYLEAQIQQNAASIRVDTIRREVEARYLKLDRETEKLGTNWDDLEARFLELQRDAEGLTANWNSVESWNLRGCGKKSVRGLFQACATVAALRLTRRAGGDPKFFLWIDRLREQEPNQESQLGGNMRSAVLFWLDRLKDDSPNYKAQSATRGTIHEVCQASGNYCGRLSRGYMPVLHFRELARGERSNEHTDSRPIPKHGQRKPPRRMSDLSRALVMGFLQRPEATGAWLSQWLDEQGVQPTPKMLKNGCRSFEDAYGDTNLKHGLDAVFSRIRSRMKRDGAL